MILHLENPISTSKIYFICMLLFMGNRTVFAL